MDEISGFQVIFLYLQYTNMAIKKNPQAKIFWKVAFSIILIVYFNILKSKVLVHFVDPTARFGRGVYSVMCALESDALPTELLWPVTRIDVLSRYL